MHYETQYEICALLFLVILTVRFFGVRQFPSRENRVFGIILNCAIADLVLDIIGAYTIHHAATVPVWLNYLINTVFYALQVLFPVLMALYALIMAGRFFGHRRQLALLLAPGVVFELLLLVNPLTHWIFHIPVVDGAAVYTRGPIFNVLYLGVAFYVLVTVLIVRRHRASLLRKQAATIYIFILMILAATVLQFFYPRVLLTGVAIAAAIQMMFYTLQNPETMLDQLTGTFNYDALIVYLHTQLNERRPFGLVTVDVGGIRRVNSTFGMQMGNQALERVGAFLNGFHGRAWAFRMAGTRFLLVTSGAGSYDEMIHQVERRFAQPWKAGEVELMLTVTLRYFNEPGFFGTAEEVVNLIDVAYSEIGSGGWGTSKAIDTALLSTINRRLKVENAVRDAIADDSQFEIYYQPVYSLSQRRYTGAEALLRLHSRDLGDVSPAEFIPVAEKAGLVPQIDDLVVRKVCAFLRRSGTTSLCDLERMNINLSAADFFRNRAQQVHALVLGSGAVPGLLCFEVTETAATVHQDVLAEFMADMQGYGYTFALDDFGTGYANITQVTQLPFSVVKLDRTMLLAGDEQNRVLFDGLLRMFSDMGLTTVVEGVESAQQVHRVERLGADRIQGYFYAGPMPEHQFLEFMEGQEAVSV